MGSGEGLGPLAGLTRKGSIIDTARELIDRLEEEPTKVESGTVVNVVTVGSRICRNQNKCLGIRLSGKNIVSIILTVEY